MVIHPKENTSFIHKLEKWKTSPGRAFVTFLKGHDLFHRKPNIIPRSIRSVWYQYFGLNMQEIASTENTSILRSRNLQILEIFKYAYLHIPCDILATHDRWWLEYFRQTVTCVCHTWLMMIQLFHITYPCVTCPGAGCPPVLPIIHRVLEEPGVQGPSSLD